MQVTLSTGIKRIISVGGHLVNDAIHNNIYHYDLDSNT